MPQYIVWSPHLLRDKATIEKVQHFALRVCLKDWSLGYDEAMELSRLPSLETQRNRATLCFLCNIVHQNMDFEVLQSHQDQSPNSQDKAIAIGCSSPIYSRTAYYQNSFFPRAISMWNSLPEEVLANCTSLPSFRHAIMH